MPQINDPTTPRDRPAICSHNAGNHSVCDTRWRYIRYADGGEELYDRLADPLELTNVLWGGEADPELRQQADRLATFLPANEEPLAPGSRARILEKRDDGFYWQGEKIKPEDVVK